MKNEFWESVLQKIRKSNNDIAMELIIEIQKIFIKNGMDGVQEYILNIENSILNGVGIDED